jgi:hypothetical protein
MTQQAVYEFGGKSYVANEWFVARITSVGSSTGNTGCDSVPYAWIEQRVCNSGYGYQDAELAGRPDDGETALNQSPAFVIGNGTAQVGDIVLMRARGLSANGYPIMEFLPKAIAPTPPTPPTPPGGTWVPVPNQTITVVTNIVCLDGNLVVTKKIYFVPSIFELQ